MGSAFSRVVAWVNTINLGMNHVLNRESTRHKMDETDSLYKQVKPESKQKLETFYQHIVSNAPVDFTNQETKDIQNAVHIILERISERVNKRGVFDITRIVPAGSMAEEISIWRLDDDDKEQYLEFDYLAVLKASIRQCEDQNARNCSGCIEIKNPPVTFEQIRKQELKLKQAYHVDVDSKFHKGKCSINSLFKYEIHNSLISSCDCLVLNHESLRLICHTFKASSVDKTKGCEKCIVEMSTGTLRVKTEEVPAALSDCTVIFQWTSKATSLLAPDKFLLQKHRVVSIPIYVDFLPAIETRKLAPSGAEYEHDYFIIPKRCNVCPDSDEDKYRWRKSWCMAEIRAFRKAVNKHRRCYQIIKYFTSLSHGPFHWPVCLNRYLIKTVVLQHIRTCSDKTDCVTHIYRNILHAYISKKFLAYHSNINIAIRNDLTFEAQKSYFKTLLTELCSVSQIDTFEGFVNKLLLRCRNATSKDLSTSFEAAVPVFEKCDLLRLLSANDEPCGVD